jgi:hypothetical protein
MARRYKTKNDKTKHDKARKNMTRQDKNARQDFQDTTSQDTGHDNRRPLTQKPTKKTLFRFRELVNPKKRCFGDILSIAFVFALRCLVSILRLVCVVSFVLVMSLLAMFMSMSMSISCCHHCRWIGKRFNVFLETT